MSKQIIAMILLIAQGGICNAALLIDSQSVVVDMANQEALFTIADSTHKCN